MTKTKALFTKNGEEVGLYDVCEWIVKTYPKDIFVDFPIPVTQMRDSAQIILKQRKRFL